MAAGPYIFPDRAKLNLFNATNLLAANTALFKLALLTSTWTPDNATNELFGDISANEIAGVNGYVSGGILLTGVVLSLSSGAVRFTHASAQWTATGGSIAAWRRGVIYYAGTLNGKLNPLLGHFLGDTAPADIPATTAGNPLTVTPNAAGVLQAA